MDYFYGLTPREFYNLISGYREKELEKQKQAWSRARLQMYYSVLGYADQKKLKPSDLLQFPWEEQTTDEPRKPKSTQELKKVFKNTTNLKK